MSGLGSRTECGLGQQGVLLDLGQPRDEGRYGRLALGCRRRGREWRGGRTYRREEVVVQTQEVGECPLASGQRVEPGRDGRFGREGVLLLVVVGEFPDPQAREPGQVQRAQVPLGELGTQPGEVGEGDGRLEVPLPAVLRVQGEVEQGVAVPGGPSW
ncbi:hypothetical protein [Streptomyces sp. NPDC005507]|uniref:hypothetical protein n=1 Tax=Streptomyces sp. NPDC005507 TaxID=3154885 RepID=UPI0033B02345